MYSRNKILPLRHSLHIFNSILASKWLWYFLKLMQYGKRFINLPRGIKEKEQISNLQHLNNREIKHVWMVQITYANICMCVCAEMRMHAYAHTSRQLSQVLKVRFYSQSSILLTWKKSNEHSIVRNWIWSPYHTSHSSVTSLTISQTGLQNLHFALI